jgi:hypothetical protein
MEAACGKHTVDAQDRRETDLPLERFQERDPGRAPVPRRVRLPPIRWANVGVWNAVAAPGAGGDCRRRVVVTRGAVGGTSQGRERGAEKRERSRAGRPPTPDAARSARAKRWRGECPVRPPTGQAYRPFRRRGAGRRGPGRRGPGIVRAGLARRSRAESGRARPGRTPRKSCRAGPLRARRGLRSGGNRGAAAPGERYKVSMQMCPARACPPQPRNAAASRAAKENPAVEGPLCLMIHLP